MAAPSAPEVDGEEGSNLIRSPVLYCSKSPPEMASAQEQVIVLGFLENLMVMYMLSLSFFQAVAEKNLGNAAYKLKD
ncbi:hypothetical protein KIN20_019004 [Parelaphostrongylus tenuis]|uniref:Uncharacterized protein n=2 Tax=Parelaphostrongylus tenuis TaxID=148309 RepID=A0AAD5MKE7_PARTN|nr:hypothetical protein KIN20_019004 [Parelaphostrongylus tenuis]